MKIRNVDKNWDWTFGKSNSNFVRDRNAILLDIQMKFKEWQNDCYFALNHGIPWDIRLGFRNQKKLMDADVLRVAQSVNGVLNITNFESYVQDRRYRATFTVFTEYSTEALPIVLDMKI